MVMSLVIFLKSNVETILTVVAIICLPIILLMSPYISKEIGKGYNKKQTQKKEAKIKEDELNTFDKNLERLEKLGKLYKDGIITKEEFEEKKKEFKI